jgi:endonuclease YncB( thermonuclease family)
MTLTDARMKELAALYGNLGEVNELSALRAAKDDLAGSKTLNKEDFAWLQSNVGYTVPVDNSSANANTFYKVTSIVDGDTIHAQPCSSLTNGVCQIQVGLGDRFRLYHVSAAPFEWADGVLASEWLGDQIPPGVVVTMENKGSDPYGRDTVIIYRDGININQLMVQSGLAKSWDATDSNATSTDAVRVPSSDEIIPTTVTSGKSTLYKYNIKNNATTAKKYWLGIELTNSSGVTYTYTGNQQYGKTISPGAAALLTSIVPAQTVAVGNVTVRPIINKV